MAYSAKVGSFNIDTTKTVGQDQSVTGVGFQPKVIMFWWSGASGTSDGVQGEDISMGFGAAKDASNEWAFVSASDDANGTSTTRKQCYNTYSIFNLINGGGTVDGAADFVSFDADGFTLNMSEQFALPLRVSYLALGGDDLTNVYVGTKVRDTDTGYCTVTGTGFQPDALIIANNSRNINGGSAGASFSVGWATSTGTQGTAFWGADNAAATTNTYGYGYNGEISAGGTSGLILYRDSFVSFDADGFTLNQLEGTGANIVYGFVALKGGQYSVGELTTRTDGNDISETVGFQPAAILFASANRALSTQDTPTDNGRLSIGAGTSASNRAAQAISDEDNLADSETATANYDSAVYANIADDAIVGLMDIKSIDAEGFTCVMDDTDPAECWVTYLAIGASGASSSSSSSSSTTSSSTTSSSTTSSSTTSSSTTSSSSSSSTSSSSSSTTSSSSSSLSLSSSSSSTSTSSSSSSQSISLSSSSSTSSSSSSTTSSSSSSESSSSSSSTTSSSTTSSSSSLSLSSSSSSTSTSSSSSSESISLSSSSSTSSSTTSSSSSSSESSSSSSSETSSSSSSSETSSSSSSTTSSSSSSSESSSSSSSETSSSSSSSETSSSSSSSSESSSSSSSSTTISSSSSSSSTTISSSSSSSSETSSSSSSSSTSVSSSSSSSSTTITSSSSSSSTTSSSSSVSYVVSTDQLFCISFIMKEPTIEFELDMPTIEFDLLGNCEGL